MTRSMHINKTTLATLLATTALAFGTGSAAFAAEHNANGAAPQATPADQAANSGSSTAAAAGGETMSNPGVGSAGMSSNGSSATAGAHAQTDSDVASSEPFITEQKSSQTLAKSIIGMSIHNSDDPDSKEIGKVTDLILNQDHKLAGIVVGVGGFLGMGQKDVGIPWSQVSEINPEKKTARVPLTKEELEKAPPFTTTAE